MNDIVGDMTNSLSKMRDGIRLYVFTSESTKPKITNMKLVFLGLRGNGELVCRVDDTWAEYHPVDAFYKKDLDGAAGFFTSKEKAVDEARKYFAKQKADMMEEYTRAKESAEESIKNLDKYAPAWNI